MIATKDIEQDTRSYTLSYPWPVRVSRASLALGLAGAAVARCAVAWVQFGGPLLRGGALADQPIRPLLAAHLGLLITVWSVGFILSFLPDLALTERALAARILFKWHTLPWPAVAEIRTMGFSRSNRRLVLIQGRWRWHAMWWRPISACLGAGTEPGLLFTSAIRDFEPLLTRVREEVSAANPNVLLDDEFFSLPARLVLEPVPTLAALAEQTRDEGWPVSISAQAMGAVSLGLVIVQLIMLGLDGGVWWQPLIILAAGAAEWAAGAVYIYALAAFLPGAVDLRQGMLLYPIAQVPRALLGLVTIMMLAAGLLWLAAMAALISVLWAVLLTALLVQQLYRLPSILPALPGAAIQALFQFMLLVLIFT
jgi:hypothetical protein